ncbi:nebulin isoform X9 [Tamandua tetradactyla]|uniref:nebulin isoform X9 n=1 Tax=Tamandua tetradactyla TaxID=48850 RepID=UPI004053C720
MADDEEYEEVVEYYTEETVYEDVPGQTITEIYETTTSRTVPDYVQSETSKPALPQPAPAKPTERKKVIRKKVDSSKFMTPYIAHSQKMQNLFSPNKYKENFEKAKGRPYASTTDTPELRRIKKVQDQLSEVKYRVDGDVAKTICHVDEKAKDIEHAKKVSQQVSKVLYKQNWEDTKDKYLLPPDAPELVQAIKNTAMFSKKRYTEDWEADKSLFYPYNDSPELRRVAQAQKALSDIAYKKGHAEQQTQFTPLPDPPDIEFAKKVTNQVSKQKYKEDYENKIKGKWSETPCFEIATARMNADNISTRKYQEDFENIKDQIYFMQTETPEYKVNKKAGEAASKVKYKEDYEKNKAKADYNVLPATENPLLRQLKAAGDALSDKLYKENYEKTKAKSINYCETPKFQVDTVLQNFSSDKKYKDSYLKNILGHYVGSYEDPYHTHCMKITAQNSDKNYKAEYEEDRGKGFFPQTITKEYEAIKKLDQCKDHTYKVHPDKTKFTQVTDSPVLVQAQVNSKQLSDLNYKAKHESEKFKCHIPPDTPAFIQHRVNAYNLSDNAYKEDWEKSKAKKFDIKVDAIPLLAAKANSRNASDVLYKKDYEKSRGKMIGALSIEDDPKMLHSLKTAKNQSDRLYRENYEKTKAKSMNYCETPKYQLDTLLKNFSEAKYKDSYVNNILGHYVGSFEDPYHTHCMRVAAQNSDKSYKAEYEEDKGKCYFPQTITQEYEAIKKLDKCKDHTYKVHPDKTKFTAVPDSPVLLQAQLNTKQLSDMNYKAKHENEKFKCNIPADAPQFIQHRVNAYNLSDNVYKHDWEKSKAKKFDIKVDAIPLLAAKANSRNASDVLYKKDYEKSRGKMIGALSIEDDPKMLHSLKTAKNQSDRLYKENYEKTKAKSVNYCETPKYQLDTLLKNFSEAKYKDSYVKNILGHYVGSFEDPYHTHCMKIAAQNSDKSYKAEYEEDKGKCYFPQTITQEYEAIKKLDKCKDHTYKVHPDKTKFTAVTDSPVLLQAQLNTKQLSDMNYKAKHESEKFKCNVPVDAPQFIQHRVNAYNLSDNVYKHDWEKSKAKKFDIKVDAIPLLAAKANSRNASDVLYKKDYEKSRGKMIGALSIEDDPKMLHSLKTAKNQSDRLYRENYEKTKAKSMNYCETPKYQLDTLLKNFSEAKYKDSYVRNILGHYVGSFEDPYQTHCMRVAAQNSDKSYKAEYEEDKGKCYFPQTITQEYEAIKKLDKCKDHTYKVHPDKTKFTAVTDSPVLLQAQLNTKQLSDLNYKAKHESEKFKCNVPADAPQFIQHRVNAYNLSDNVYKHDWEKSKAKKFDIKVDAIPLLAAKANSRNASDVLYKKDYEKSRGKMIGALSIEDDPKMLHSLKTAKNQSDREYRKDYEKSKTIYTAPLDMLQVTQAKKSQAIASDVDYRHVLHDYRYPPDSVNVDLAKKAYALQSDVEYKADYNSWMKGCGWVPFGSLEMEKAKRASDILNEKKYRQHPDTLKFTSIEDAPIIVQSKINQAQRSDIVYKAKVEEILHKYNLPADLPQFLQAKVNAYNISENMYKAGLKDLSKKGYDLRTDAIPIKAAKAARQVASDVQYKKDYEKAKGKMVGFQSLQDDPKLVHYMNVAKLQSDREYKKDYEKTKTKHNTPHDMVNVVAAKKAQDIVSNVNYKHSLHHYTYLPDAMDLELSKNMMRLQSDNAYKEDYNTWMKGIGWIPIGSLDAEKVRKAGDALNEKKYRQHPDTLKFTSIVDSPVMVQAKQNTQQISDILYKAKGEDVKHKYTMSPDLPQFLQAKCNAYNISDVCYKRDWHDLIAKGNNVLGDAIPITAAKASRNIASDYKYKEAYEKAKGRHVGFRSIQDDPKLVHYMNVAKLQSDREYKKNYENTKTSYHTPGDMVSITAAKMAQDVATNVNYKQPIHHYTYLPDALSFAHTRNANQIQSDNVYKDEYNNFFKGIGWIPIGSLEVEKAKKAGDALNERKYRQHPDTIKFTSLPDSMGMVLAQQNTKQLSDLNYKVEGEKLKHKYTMDPEVPQFIQAKVNALNMSDAHYKADWKKTLAKGYDLRSDAIPIVAAKSSRNIASDFKYKEAYEKAKGKQIGFLSLQDDPKLVHYMNVAKIQSDREYKKGYEASKTSYHTPLDMFSVTAAKKSQEAVTNINYKQPFHTYTLLPDAVNVEHSRNAMQIQSDNLYRSDFTNWMKGIGWIPIESLEVEKAKKAGEILSEKKYRQHPEKLKFTYSMDTMEQALNKSNKLNMDKRLYTEKWNKDKSTIHVMPDTPDILLSKVNQITMSDKLYKAGWEEEKKKGYDLRPDAISIKAARASRDIASDYKYKQAYEQTKGKHIGFRSLEDDPKLVHFMQVAKMQSDREYKKGYEKSKTSFHTPVDMLSVVTAKRSQEVATNTNYRNLIHTYNMLPDAMSFELAKNMMQIQSDNQYKADYADFMKGIGWLPLGSLEAEKNKKAMEIISEKKYRQHPDTLKYSMLMDSMNMVLAQNNAKIMNEHLYKQAWEADKTKVHIMPDIPQIVLAKANAINMSDKLYKLSLEESRKKGYDLRTDAIPIQAAKASRDIASDYKYRQSYEKERGKMVGFRSLEDDPKLVHSMQVAKMQSDREYKKNYENTKTSYHTPADMLSVTAAKDAQANITNTNYKHLIHKYILLPDAMNIELARNMNRVQSDNEYKQDYNEWYKGLGWSPAGSLEVEKAKRATEYVSDQKYRQHPSNFQFKKLNDSMDMVLAKQNAHTMNKHLYTIDWDKEKTKIHVMPDTPDILQAKQNQTLYSQKFYKLGWEEALKKGYDLPLDAISVQLAKASRDIASDYKYKQGYRKQLGHHIGFRNLEDDPKLVLSMNVAKMQSDREYKKDFEKWKTKFSSPVDMLGVVLAKKCQALVSDVDYRNYLHGWTCLPDQNDVIQAKKAYELQSENVYKSDLEWLRGIGWSPLGSLEAEKNKRASEIISEKKYRQPPDQNKFTSIPDAMDIVLAKTNAKNRSDILYREAWDKDKTQIHIMPDTPDIILAKANLINTSDKLYRMGYEELKKKGYDLPLDAIPVKAAKASREIASDYKYKEGFRKQLGHHIGARNIEDDPKMMWSMHVAKMQSDREYKKDFEKWKTKFSSPVDMLGVVQAKKCQALVSDVDYRNYLHQWICLPDQNDVIHARRAYDLQSDNLYKADLQWLKGIGWLPSGSLEDEKNKRATQILSDHVYRQHPDKFKFSSLLDSIPMVLAKNNAITMNHHLYTEAWDKDKTSVHIMPDTPEVLLAKQNKINYSEKLYKLGLEEARKKGCDLRLDAIPIQAAKASRDIASEYKYKEGYRKQLGHHIGARAVHDDPKMMWSMYVAKMQSDREYKKDFEKWKTKFSSPVDMLGVVLAKKCQALVSDVDYRNYLHQWICLPDQNDVIHARRAYDLQSDNMYKSDLQWLRGIGWVPIGSVDVEKCKRATEILSDKIYRQPPDKLKFTSVTDSLEQVLAKNNAITMNKRLYTEAWDKDKTQVHIMPDTPEIMLARMNKINYSESLYKLAHEEAKKEGYDLRIDAIPIVAAKASRDIASDYKYKDGYRKQLGHHIGARKVEDDPKMMWSMHVAKMQSDREYKKDFEKWKTKFSSPVDMLGVVQAKKCQALVSDVDYRNYLHQWICLPDQNDVIHARRAYDLQSDNVYKSDLEWLRGIGWVPIGSVDVEKCKRATEILSDKVYRQPPDQLPFTSVTDSPEQVLAKNNAITMSKHLYTEAWDKDKTQIHIMPDTPEIMLARQNKINYSETLYKLAHEEAKKEGYDLRIDAIPIVAAKASRDIASDYKYKDGYRKQLGHHIGARKVEDDPKMMWSMHVAKMQSDREYKKDFEKWKTKFSSPVDMLGVVQAKKCQTLVSDVDYRNYLHQWICLPDQNDVIHARRAYDLQSDNVYKSDLQWLRGIGWIPIGSPDVVRCKKAAEILSDNVYRLAPDQLPFTSVTDSLEQVLAKNNAITMNKRLYTEAWDKDKTQIHIMPDTPEIMLARQNRINYSENIYRQAMEEAKKEGYDLRSDAIPIVAAKASRDIASDYKYKEAYRKQLGHHIGARTVRDDPKILWSLHIGKVQSDLEYKKEFEKYKTRYSSPVDMLGIVLAKKCQTLVSDVDYKHPLHEWTCLPDQNDVIQARKAYELQSDNLYKSDLEWLKGIGWVPIGSVEVVRAKRAAEILSDNIYRQRPDALKFTCITDTPEQVLARSNAINMNKHLYTEAWDNDKKTIHVMPDTPEIMLAKLNRINYSDKLYKLALEESRKEGYDLRLDAIPIQAAKASREIASDYKYKEGYRKQLGHHIGARNVKDDPKIMWSIHAAKIQSDREYKKDFEKWKTKFSSPVDMLGVVQAKKCQVLVSDIDYKHPLHEWTCLPDQNDVIQARKAYDLQSDALYKADLDWLRGIGWVPIDSVDVKRVKKAGEILSEKKYRQPVEQLQFTCITDTPEIVLAKNNALTMSKHLYTEAWDTAKASIHVMPDTPEIILAKSNSLNVSQKLYTKGWDESKMKDYDLRADAIPIKRAKASRDIASDYKYKEAYEKQRGHHIGAQSVEDDPRIMCAIHAGKIQSEREYKKEFQKWKTKFSSPVDMLAVLQAKKCQTLVSDIDYRNYLHHWTCLPDQNDIIQAKKAYDLQSDSVYKADMEWLRGIGWMPEGSVEMARVRNAQDLVNERLYRTRPEALPFTSIVDTPDVVLAKTNSLQMSERLYQEAWNRDKSNINIPSDTPLLLQAQINALQVSNNLYQKDWNEAKQKGYDIRADAIEIKRAKASREIASEYKYKEGYRKQLGHHVGFRTLQDDPKLVWSIHAAKIQSDREYKKAYEKSKGIHNTPLDMMSIVQAKKCQVLVSDIDYRNYLHQWICLPDQNDVIQAKKAYELQSDNIYKSDLEWMKGIGWLPEGSVEVMRVKNAQNLVNERLYRTRPEALKFTSIVDTPDVIRAKINAVQISEPLYRDAWDREKANVSVPADTPVMLQSKLNAMHVSNKRYQQAWEDVKMTGYDLKADAIEIQHAKASREIASDYLYKTAYEKQKGHYVGYLNAKEDPKLSWAAKVLKMQNDRLYKKVYNDHKAKISIPPDMVSINAAKEGQALASDVDYRQYLHQWSCFPDQNDVVQARKAYDLQSDAIYKADLEWLRGIGWMPEGSPEVLRVKNAQKIFRDSVYRTPVQKFKYTSITDTPEVVLAKSNAEIISIPKYREVWDKDKVSIHIMPDTPEINLARANALNVSNKLYREGWDEMKMSCDVRLDAIPIQSAKASREIASDYKYKLEHEKQKGHYVGTSKARDDNRIRWALIAGKIQNEREYRLPWAKWKTKFQSPADMLSILHSKKCQTLVSDIDYRNYLHEWTCMPDQNDVIQAKKAYELQSDAIYKADLEWLRGIGWLPNDSVSVNHAKHAADIFSEKKYRTKIETLNFTPVDDRVDYVTAKQSGEILDDIKYRKHWNDIKSKYTLTETPLLHTAQEAARILDQYLYKEGWERQKATGYILPPDAVPFVHAQYSGDVQSELKYKAEHVKQKGHYVGVPTMRDDPKLVWFEHAGQIQNDRLYKENYHKTKSKINIPADMVSVLAAKQGQTLVSDIDYRNYLHQWICHPDQNDVIQARKAYDLQSDNIYKADLEWLRGIGWIPLDSVEHVRVTKNQEMVNQIKYKKDALENYPNFTSVVDPPAVVLAKINSVNQSDVKYKETFNKHKGKYTFSPDTPYISHSKDMGKLYSTILYKGAWEGTKAYGYTLDERYIPIVGAKHADYVNSELKYKETYVKQKGHYLAGKEISEFPAVVHSLDFQKMRSVLNYRRDYENTKANVHIPIDMMNHVLAKHCQYILSDLEYQHYFHQWTSLPEEPKFICARNAQEILSDNVYKDDLNWLKGIGCYVWDTPQILQAKKAYDLQSQLQYTAAGKENLQNYKLVTDTPLYVTALQSGINASEVKYKENYHRIKDKYTTVLKTVDYDRTKNLKDLYSSNLYKEAWDKVKATSYKLSSNAVSLTHAKNQKHLPSIVKYREEYEKFKALYTLPKSVDDDPNTARCLRVGKLNIDRLYRSVYEKNKMKIHIVPDMVEMVTAKDSQKKVSEIDYRLHLHEWICHPDLQVNSHVRKVTDQISDIVYKDDLNWLKGIGCYVWDTPEILHAKHAYDLRNDIKYKAHVQKTRNNYKLVMDTPVYVQAVKSGKQLSDAVYHYDYIHSVRGRVAPTVKTVDLNRALHAYKLQSENLYRGPGLRSLPTGYRLPVDTPHFKHNKNNRYMSSYFKYKEVYEHIKANGYTLGPKDVPFVHVRRVNNVTSERLYRELYHKLKDKIHTTPDTPEIRQVKKTQEAVSELIYKSDFFKMQGHMISLPYTPQVLHCRYVGDITSDIKYKEDLRVLRGLGCFLYDTPDMVRSRHLRKLWSNYLYTDHARKTRDKYRVVLDTPEYRKVQELKTHLSELVYRAAGRKQKSIFTSVPDTPDLLRAKRGQKLQSQYLYIELATKERPHHHAGNQTRALRHAKDVKDMVSETKYKIQYEKMKDKYTPVPDTPILIRAKKAYWNASDLRYKETFQKTKGRYHTVKDALDIVYHRKVTDDISKVKYKENYMSQLGFWRSIPDRPEHFHHRAVTDAVSDVKYKEDLTWLKGIGCYAYDTPDFTLAEKNKTLYSKYKYKEVFERTKSDFKYVADCPINRHFKYATQLMNEKKYKSSAKMLLQQGCNEILRPDMLTALYNTHMWSQIKYRKKYEKTKDKFTSIVDTPEHLRTTKVNKQISDILYKLEYNKAKPRGYTTIHDTPMLLHVRKVKDEVSDLKYKEVYQRNKSNCTIEQDAVHIKAAKDAYKVNTNLDYKKQYEANKAHWRWIPDRPDFIQAAKSSLQQSDFEYKLDREFLKGCKLSVTDDKNTVLALRNSLIESDLKYKEKHVKERGSCHAVPDTPQILLAKNVSHLVSENKYKDYVKKHLAQGSYTTLPETRDTVHVKEVTKNVSDTNYKKKFVKEKGKSNYSIMLEPPEVKHAMEVAKKQSNVAYKKDAKENLHYTTVADRPDIKKATQAAKQASEVEYRAKHRKEGSHGLSMLGRPDIEMAKKAAKLSSQVKYQENFKKEKGKTPKFNPKDSQLYKVMKDANDLASEVKYKADLKKLHKPVTDMKESLIMNHVLSTSQLASSYQYKKKYEKSKGHYHTIPDNLEQLHLKEATELQSIVKYKEKYEKERGKPMLDFETPTYITAKESQQMQSGKEYRKEYEESIKGRNLTGLEVTPALLHVKYATRIASEKEYRKDLEESIRGKGLNEMEDTPDMLRAKNATQILNEKEYKRDLELEVKGRGLNAMANETPDFMRARNATDIASQIKYKQLAEMEKSNFTSVVDTPEIIHAQQVKNLSSQKKYKEDAEKSMSYYETVLDTPEIQRVRENQKNFSLLQYQCDLKNSKGKITVVQDTPEILRVKENQKNFSSVLYKEDVTPGTAIGKTPEMMRIKQTQDHISTVKYKEAIGQGTPIPDLPEVKRVKETQKHISSVMYKENLGTGIPTPVTPEIERVRRNQENFSSVLYKENVGKGTPTPMTPEMERAKRNQENFSSILYKENLSKGTPLPVTPEMERVKRNQENFSSVLYKENVGKATPTPVTPEMQRVKRNQENISSVLYKENLGKATPTPFTPEMERVKRNQENFSSVLYKENMRKATSTPVTPEMERAKRNQENISSVLYSDSFRKQIQGKAAYVLDTPEMRRVRETQRHISTVKYHEDFEKHKGCFTPVVTDPITERVKKNTQDFSDINYRGIQRKVVEMEQKRNDQDQETITGLRVWRTNPGSVFDYDPAEDNIQSRSLHMINVQAQRRNREQSRSASALSISGGEEKSEHSETTGQHLSNYSDGGVFFSTSTAYKHAKTTELPQQRSSSVATQQTTVSSIPSHPSTAGKIFRAMYDYMAADADEVSFKDGDAIVNVQAIDEGWMYGTVQRTGRTGMLPANYVEAI